MDDRLVLGRDPGVIRAALAEIPDTVEEALRALDGLVGPGNGLLKVADEHDVQAHGICAVLIDDIIGVDDVAAGLRHLLAALAEDHAVAGALLIRLLGRHDADVIQELMPEAAVEQVERGVLHAAVVPVDRAPVIQSLLGGERLVVVRIHVAQEVPARAGPLRHGVGLTLGGTAALRAGGIDPVGHLAQRALAVIGGLIAVHLRQHERKLILRDRHPAALRAVDQRDRLAPVTLAAEDPVTQLVVDLLLADPLLHDVFLHGGDGLFDGHAVEEAGVDHDGAVVLGDKGLLCHVAAGDDLDDRQAELRGKLPVALVVARNAHDDAGAIAHEDVVGNKHGQRLVRHGIHDLDALETDTGLFLVELAALEVGLVRSLFLIGGDSVPVGDMRLPLLEQRVLGRDNHVRRAEERVGTGGIDGDVVTDVGLERDLGTGGAADPVALLNLDALDVIHIIQIVDQALGVLRDGEHPLALLLAYDLAAAALADAVDDLFVCQHALAARAPVDRHGGLIGQTVLEHLQEDPLCPLIVGRVGRVDRAIPVKAVAEHLELLGEVCNVVFRDNGRMDVVFDGIVLGRQTERIKSDREQDIVALHPALAADDVHRRERARVADVQPLSGGIRELDQPVKLRARITGDGRERLFRLPARLPFFLDCLEIILHSVHFSLKKSKTSKRGGVMTAPNGYCGLRRACR